MVPEAGLEPAFLAEGDFLTTIAFATISVCGLDYTFTVAFFRLRCLPSSLYTFKDISTLASLGIGILQRSPNLTSSTLTVSN